MLIYGCCPPCVYMCHKILASAYLTQDFLAVSCYSQQLSVKSVTEENRRITVERESSSTCPAGVYTRISNVPDKQAVVLVELSHDADGIVTNSDGISRRIEPAAHCSVTLRPAVIFADRYARHENAIGFCEQGSTSIREHAASYVSVLRSIRVLDEVHKRLAVTRLCVVHFTIGGNCDGEHDRVSSDLRDATVDVNESVASSSDVSPHVGVLLRSAQLTTTDGGIVHLAVRSSRSRAT